ncbi:MAG: hypothetical protein HS115_00880 [Spirochaetales bacterium]|nr:hypothetical protein [Spirochaetales bacterium]
MVKIRLIFRLGLLLLPLCIAAIAIAWPDRYANLAASLARLKSEQNGLVPLLSSPLFEPPSLKERRSQERLKPQL